MPRKYSDEFLLEMAKNARNMIQMMSLMGYQSTSGSMQKHLKQRLVRAGADLSHWTKGNTGNVSSARLLSSDVLVQIPESKLTRQRTVVLRRCLLETGQPYQCAICSVKEWNGKPIVLQVDHIDGNWRNNNIGNLRFLCPNCHSQTETWGYISKGM